MRELKFRAWYAPEKEYIPDVQATYDNACEGKGSLYHENFREVLEDEDCVVEQYTGLKDKNGKEIYEGDIVEGSWLCGKDKHIVKYEDYGFYPFTVTDFDGDPMIRNVDIEVIGNIHKNPELLEGEK